MSEERREDSGWQVEPTGEGVKVGREWEYERKRTLLDKQVEKQVDLKGFFARLLGRRKGGA